MNLFFIFLNFVLVIKMNQAQQFCYRNPLSLVKNTTKIVTTTTTAKTTVKTTSPTTKLVTTTTKPNITTAKLNPTTKPGVSVTYKNQTDPKQGLIPPGLDPSIDMSKFNPLNLNSIQMSILQVLLMGTCYRDSFTRGAGVPVSYCDPETFDKDGALCYPKCENGYDGNGPLCWEQCKEGFTDRGAFCIIDLYVYNKGCCCLPGIDDECCNSCPANYTDDGCTCRRPPKSHPKKSYGRGSGESLSCTPEEELNGLLCYPICREGYGGAGPVCWKNCNPPLDNECGALCAVNQPNCVVKSLSLVTVLGPPFQAFANLAGGIISIAQIPQQYIVAPCLT